MTLSNRCSTCVGLGQIMGGGMLMRDCPACDGLGKIFAQETKKVMKAEIDRRSKSYRESIAKIMSSEGCSREEAADLFDEAYEKLE